MITKYHQFINESNVDKYELLEEIEDCLLDVTDDFQRITLKEYSHTENLAGKYMLYLNDTKENTYADDNYYLYLYLESGPKGISDEVNYLKNEPYYKNLLSSIKRLKGVLNINDIEISYENLYNKPTIQISMYVNDKTYGNYESNTVSLLKSQGFKCSGNYISMNYEKLNIKLLTQFPKPYNKNKYYSMAKDVQILDNNWNNIGSFDIDERKFNKIYSIHLKSGFLGSNQATFYRNRNNAPLYIENDENVKDISDKNKLILWLENNFKKMKMSNDNYNKGSYESKGKIELYAHDFMLYLKNNQDKYEIS